MDKTVARSQCIIDEELYLKKAVDARNRFIELSIIEGRFCPECGSRVYMDECDRIRCLREKRIPCTVIDLYKTISSVEVKKSFGEE